MKIVILLGTFLFTACSSLNASQPSKEASCNSLNIKVGGVISWKKRDRKTKKIKTFTNYSDIGVKWDSNDNYYEKMIIKSDSKVSSVEISRDEKKIGDFKVINNDGYEVTGFSFKKEVTQKTKPFKLKLKIKLNNNKSCIHLVKVKRAES